MEHEIEQLVQAITIASDPTQISLHPQALSYIRTIQENISHAWRAALHIFLEMNTDGSRKYNAQARFFALGLLDDFFENR